MFLRMICLQYPVPVAGLGQSPNRLVLPGLRSVNTDTLWVYGALGANWAQGQPALPSSGGRGISFNTTH